MLLGKIGEGIVVILVSAIMFFIALPEIMPEFTAISVLLGTLFIIGGAIQIVRGIFQQN
ncbi:MAG: hypothetical protein BTN85_1165 [Candidatus Methanohalarchaeum thermophilum]|uniref:Uncharacterized protein n=1 Tax=Methanohalarchaeum thermophilum TaxID=1903181 RepID=A0A1Q6DWF5_METT1|nr:MAG: hypothetical protein BTN85_1165 [Candidatus Methanohalarchaeum thermophilum]